MTVWKAWTPVHIIMFCAILATSKKTSGQNARGGDAAWLQSSTTVANRFQPDDSFEWHFVVPSTSFPAVTAAKTSNQLQQSSSGPSKTKDPNNFRVPKIDPGLSLVWNSPLYLDGLEGLTEDGTPLQTENAKQPKRKQGTRYEAKTKISLSEYESHDDESTEQPSELSDEDVDVDYDSSTDDDDDVTTFPATEPTTTPLPKPEAAKLASADKLVPVTKASKISKLKTGHRLSTSTKRTPATTRTTSTAKPNLLPKIPIIRKPVAIIRDQSKLIKQQVEATTPKVTKKLVAQGRAVKPRSRSTTKPPVQRQVSYKPEATNEKIIRPSHLEVDDIDWENTPLKVPQGDFGMRIRKRTATS